MEDDSIKTRRENAEWTMPQDAVEQIENEEEQRETIWTTETETITIDGLEITAPKLFSKLIFDFLSTLHLPNRLYAGDDILPIRPIDIFSATAHKMGVAGKNIVFKIEMVPYIDMSDDGQALIVCLSKYNITNPRTGLLRELSDEIKALLNNQGEVAMTKKIRQAKSEETSDHVFNRARFGEALGYQIPAERQIAYYRGISFERLKEISTQNGLTGRNSDRLFINLDPTIWAYCDPGMAEYFAGKNRGIILKLKKQKTDSDYQVSDGWQNWTVNEKMITSPGQDKELVMSTEYIEEIIVFDDEGERLVDQLFPGIAKKYLKTTEDAQNYLVDNGEMTDEELERYYDDPKKIPGYSRPLELNSDLELLGLDGTETYEQCQQKIEQRVYDLYTEIQNLLGLGGWKPGISDSVSLYQIIKIVAYSRQNEYFRLPRKVIEKMADNPDINQQIKNRAQILYKLEDFLKTFKKYEGLMKKAKDFKG